MLRLFPDREALSKAAAELVVEKGEEAIRARGRFDLVLSGGLTPRRTYEILAERFGGAERLWSATHVWWGDERCVPPDYDESNYRMAADALLERVPVRPGSVHRIEADDPDADAAAARYAHDFPSRTDLVILGLGADGHTASLFPGSEALGETARRYVAVEGPSEPKRRITITPPAIEACRLAVVLVWGREKSDAFSRVFSAESSLFRTPARLVRGATWLADLDAAGEFIRAGFSRILGEDPAQPG